MESVCEHSVGRPIRSTVDSMRQCVFGSFRCWQRGLIPLICLRGFRGRLGSGKGHS